MSNLTTIDKIEQLEGELIRLPQLDLPLAHHFAPGIYYREIFMPAGAFIIGHQHKTEHFNIVLTGRASVMINGKVEMITAPCTFKSIPGVRKILFIHEDMRWATIHPTELTDVAELEELLIVKSNTYKEHANEIKKFQLYLGGLN
jgi:hypothetical protein